MSTDLSSLATPLSLPLSALEAISKKASELLDTDGAIVNAPGYPSDSCMVLSCSGKRPHLVTPRKNGGFSCDDECPQYKSSKLCSHVVAVAERSQRLSSLVLALQKEKNKGPNLSKLALTTMPKGRGRKGGKLPPRKRAGIEIEQRLELNSIQSLQQANVGQMTSGTSATLFSNSPLGVSHPYCAGPSTSFSSPPLNYQPWLYPPPEDPMAHGENPFRLMFISGNISVCFGCQSRYNKDLGPPNDLCIQHKENRSFTQNGQLQYRFGNAYYHVNVDCVRRMWSTFAPSMLLIEPDIDELLSHAHKSFLNDFLC